MDTKKSERHVMNRPSYWNHNAAYYPWVAAKTHGCRRVLDVGCGNGELALLLARDSRCVTGIDPSEVCIARARTRAGRKNVHFVCTSLEDFSAEEPYDAIVFVASLHHMDMRGAIARAKELLAAGGVIAVVGLALPSTLLDHVVDTLRVIPSWVSSRLHRMQTSEELGVPTAYDLPTMAQVRELAVELLPGATIRPGLHWRYLLLWKKGIEAGSDRAGSNRSPRLYPNP